MPMDKLINLIATVTLLEMMVMIGLGVSITQITSVAKDVSLVVRALIGSYVLVPLAAVGLLILFHAHPLVAVGFLMAAVCPGAPYGPPFTGLAKGNVPLSVGLMVILAALSAVFAPLLLQVLLPVIGGHGMKANVLKMVSTLLLGQFLPLCVGLAIRNRRPELAHRLEAPAKKISMVLNLLTIILILAAQWRMLSTISYRGLLGMLLLVIATVVAGWVVGGSNVQNRRAMTAATSIRNVGVSLVLVTGSFPGTPGVTSVTAYALFQTVLLAVFFGLWGKAVPVNKTAGASA